MTNLLKLGDIIFHKKGNAFKSTDFREVGVPVVRVTDFTQDGIDSKNVVYVYKSLFLYVFIINNKLYYCGIWFKIQAIIIMVTT